VNFYSLSLSLSLNLYFFNKRGNKRKNKNFLENEFFIEVVKKISDKDFLIAGDGCTLPRFGRKESSSSR
jgi:hypothetical protein